MISARTGILCINSIIYDVDALNFFSATGITDPVIREAVNTFVVDLKANLIWSKFVAIYIYVGGTAFTHSYNLKNPGLYQMTWLGGIIHNTLGVKGNKTTGYGNTNLNINTLPTNDIHLAAYSRTTGINGFDMGALITPRTELILKYDTGSFLNKRLWDINNSVANSSNATPIDNELGLFQSNRSTSNIIKLYRRGIINFSDTDTSAIPVSGNITIMRVIGGGSFSSRVYSYNSIGYSMTDGEALIHNNLVQTLQTSLSRNIY